MPIEYQDVVRTGVARQVADKIRAAILDGRLQIDERLPTEEDLAKSFGISRPTVREALKRLAAQNLIRSQRGPTGGTFVSRPDPEGLSSAITGAATLLVGVGAFDIDEIISARLETEAICCRLACERRSDADLAAMRAEITLQRSKLLSDEDFCASDVRFHRAVVQAAGNGPLSLMMYTVVEAFMPITNMIVSHVRERSTVADFHEKLAGAIEARNASDATGVLSELLAYVRDSYALSLTRRAEREAKRG
ncbi:MULTISPECIES: FadR/GntR family transcriptional regulator [Aminobacter]|jgi:DNA-binding FadR family transcriptional regulator|uniref:DNA-binding FadR family transcriptional regulator n=1 Tax=Aminobacter ciceronei TaxID=150723 RepID=A0ABR6CA88_9HYPH|nr:MULTISPECIES: FadR/GntR family transcriptional regulator [Aminobacter]MBA8907655.1 DNA-binding FadR family transcriptional regulator [Aminobacter ciceronei]MBA9021495.1 DNA-binding FadR family transcriptional regulator [Aminobacter ciceronei]MRX32441.1 GntR family transcriptional regulator [Aminobacter sp. MDW-2]QNH37737.1 FadR family transcriptional regulator [Aminobacter sp. MDW-2]QOF74437.1 FadR family transcriptional regulator [Aminobacter sp. SR38]